MNKDGTSKLVKDAGEQSDSGNPHSIVNDFSLVVATPNGSGSQTANLTLLRALFKMGIPVNGKNVFPSNIQGLPTWYYIRVSHEGFVARRDTAEILVAFNETTADEDISNLPTGGVCIYPADWREVDLRDDVIYYAVPVNQFLRQSGVRGKIRDYLANMVYVGAVAQLLGIELERIEEALSYHFGRRQELVDQNMDIINQAFEWSAGNLKKRDPFAVAPLNLTDNLVLITGNEAAALGAVFGGLALAAWYPITPSTSLIDAVNDYLPKLRKDPVSGKATYAVIQAEDELAAAGMIIGAGWAGVRAMTATSGPGLSLMAEFAGLGYFSEVPAVFWDIQRVGPSTGLPTRTSQGDIWFAYTLGHGDTKNVLLLPGTVEECFEYGNLAFDLAEQIQTPIFVMSDLDLGMNTWMSEQFEYPAEPLHRGKVMTEEDIEKRGFHRFVDVDGDGITYRTLPGNRHPKGVYFNRGTGHDEYAVYSERPEDWTKNMDRLLRKFDTARSLLPEPVIERVPGSEIGIIAFGSTLPAIEEARARLAAGGLRSSFLRLRALPINGQVREFVEQHDRVYVIEMNRDGQAFQIISLEMPELATRLHSLAFMDGLPLTARWVAEVIGSREKTAETVKRDA